MVTFVSVGVGLGGVLSAESAMVALAFGVCCL